MLQAVVLISPAVDITEVWRRRMSPEEVQQATATGRVHLPEAFAAVRAKPSRAPTTAPEVMLPEMDAQLNALHM